MSRLLPYLDNARPEEVGISHTAILSFIDSLEEAGIVMHSLLIVSKNQLIAEGYYHPYTRDTLHRMFSVSKTLTSMAIGLLQEEGQLHLDDPIVTYFPEYVSEDTHPYIMEMTIRHMLKMETCHSQTTYKADLSSDWVQSFFQTHPTHRPGTAFNYDTSASHTLCALVEKLTQMTLVDYIRSKGFETSGFSSEAYMLKDPFGVSMGGSGLMAKPSDLLLMAFLLCNNGKTLNGETLLPSDYITQAISKQTDTIINGPVIDEQQGYGYQIWRIQHNGFACYGMGGQLALCYPDKDLILITTADTQGIQGAHQTIYTSFYETVYKSHTDGTYPLCSDEAYHLYDKTLSTLGITPVNIIDNQRTSPLVPQLHNQTYRFDKNDLGFESIRLNWTEEKNVAQLTFTYHQQDYTLSFGIGHLVCDSFPIYGGRCASSGTWLTAHRLYVKSHLIDESVGSVQFHLTYKDNHLSLYMKKIEETSFHAFHGYLTGQL